MYLLKSNIIFFSVFRTLVKTGYLFSPKIKNRMTRLKYMCTEGKVESSDLRKITNNEMLLRTRKETQLLTV